MKVAILTMFNGLEPTYSLVNVVAEQLRMLLDAGVTTKVLVSEECSDEERTGIFTDARIEWVKICNKYNGKQIIWYDYSQPKGKIHDTFFEEASVIAQDYISNLSDVDVCIMHDILYQGWHLLHNIAIRKAQEQLPNLRFISFSHSAPCNRPAIVEWPFSARYTAMPKTTFVSLTYAAIPALAKQYNIPEGRCRVIHNSLDILSYLSEDVRKVAEKVDLFTPDLLIIYAGRLTPGKKFDKVAALAGAIHKKTERSVEVIFCDFPSADVNPVSYKATVRLAGSKAGLPEKNIAFTTDLGYPNGFPRQGVLDLFTLSNLFVCPSYSEFFPLTVLEAASRGNFLVLNQAVPSLEEMGKKLNAYFLRWDARNYGYDTKENYHPSEQAYYEEHGMIIGNLIRENPVLHSKTMVRQRYSPRWIWENQLEPLITL